MSGNDDQRDYWSQIAPEWAAVEDNIERVGGWFGAQAHAALGLQPGERVLDVGCGTGRTTLALARSVQPGGRAVGVDIATPMVQAARERARATAADGIEFRVADAQEEKFEAAFQGVFSRFGVMFFADPKAAFANLRSALDARGRLAVVVWQQVFANEWMLLPGMAVLSATGALPPMPGEGEPGPFSLSDPDRVRTVLSGAGFGSVEVTPLERNVDVGADEVETFVAMSMRLGAVREAMKTADDPALGERIADALRTEVRSRIGEDGVAHLAAAAWLVQAR